MGRKAVGRAAVRGRGEQGAAMVEFALILPLIVLLTFGIIEFAIAFNTDSNINQAGRAGGRTAAILSTDPDMAFKAGQAAATSLNLSPGTVEGTPTVCVAKFDNTNPQGCSQYATTMDLVHAYGGVDSLVWQILDTCGDPPGHTGDTCDDNWPISARNYGCPVNGQPTFDKVIVHVEAKHKLVVPGLFSVFFGNNSAPKFTSTAVFQLEPVSNNACP
jgi:Flp pilus assembly protein TadG